MNKPEIRPALRAVEKAGAQAIAALCLLASVSEQEFQSVLRSTPRSAKPSPRQREIEARLAHALGLTAGADGLHLPRALSRKSWPASALANLQILRGVDTLDCPPPPASRDSSWTIATVLMLYALISLAYAFELYGYL